ncbi:hypothetical protein DQ241_17635 [Blastococcus sp. TF02A-30]|nr:hypothetical protein DQ241_17635 [Blastococcus sp. TF02A-30]
MSRIDQKVTESPPWMHQCHHLGPGWRSLQRDCLQRPEGGAQQIAYAEILDGQLEFSAVTAG